MKITPINRIHNNFSSKQIYNYWTKNTTEEGLTINPLLDGPDGVGVTGKLGHSHLRDLETVTQHTERRARAPATRHV